MKKICIASLAFLLLACCGPSNSPVTETRHRVEPTRESSRASDIPETDAIKSEAGESSVSADTEFQQAGQLTAGEWNDLAHWDFWHALQQNKDFSKLQEYWAFDLSYRVSVHLKDTEGQNIKQASVDLVDEQQRVLWSSKTNNQGRAELWPFQKLGKQTKIQNLRLRVEGKLLNTQVDISGCVTEVVCEQSKPTGTQNIDIAYMVDATGSMGDELEFLKAELSDVIERVRQKHTNLNINTGSVFYRDEQDEYLTSVSEFAPGIQNTVSFIKEQYAGGGGDFPEAVHAALDATLHRLHWTPGSTRLAFMVLDAPPHYSPDIVRHMHQLTAEAAAKGIHLIPVVASGIDKETECLMRHMAILSNGTYIFLTDDSGIGNAHLQASVGEFQVERLNDLMVRVISESL